MEKIICNAETGEVLDVVKDNERVNIYSMSNVRFGYYKRQKGFFKLYRTSLPIFHNGELKYIYINTFFKLLELVTYGNVHIQIGDFPANQRKIAKYLNCDVKTVRRHLKALEKCEIISIYKIGREKFYFINPYFVYTGKTPSDDILEIFFSSRWNNVKGKNSKN